MRPTMQEIIDMYTVNMESMCTPEQLFEFKLIGLKVTNNILKDMGSECNCDDFIKGLERDDS